METPTLPAVQTQSATEELRNFMAAAKAPVPSLPPEVVPAVAVVEPAVPVVASEPAQPPAAVIPTPAIPEKFQNPDGTPNVARIEKSSADAELAYQKYLEKERVLRQKQAEVQGLNRGLPQAAPNPGEAPRPQDPFAQRIEQDIQKHGLGAVLVELHAAAEKAAYARATADIQDIRQETQNTKRRRELEVLAKHDDWLISQEGTETLGKILEAKPWLLQSPEPWKEAYGAYLADKQMSERLAGKVQTPNPKAPTVSAPATPVGASPRVLTNPINTATMNKDQINAHLATLKPEDQIKFFAERGLKFK